MPKTTSRSSRRQPKRSRLKSKQPGPLSRYAFPFYSSLPPARRPPHPAGNSGAAFAKAHLGPFPSKPKGNSSFALADILGAAGVKEIETVGSLRFHSVGDGRRLSLLLTSFGHSLKDQNASGESCATRVMPQHPDGSEPGRRSSCELQTTRRSSEKLFARRVAPGLSRGNPRFLFW